MIYLDHAAATPLLPVAKSAMEPYLAEDFFNPSAPYLPAKKVREAYESARATIAQSLGAKAPELIITAGATESITLAFTAISRDAKVISSQIEHAAVLANLTDRPHYLTKNDKCGIIDTWDLSKHLDDDVEMVSISLANNELGSIQPLSEISELIKKTREKRRASGNPRPLYLHSDASQALNLIDINVARLGVDLLTINAGKIGGPKGIGALYVRKGLRLQPIIKGGGQENGLRSGTENVPALIAFAAAAEYTKEHLASNRQKYTSLAEILRSELATITPAPIFLGNPKHQLANFVPVCFPGIDAERLIYRLEDQGILVATGAACAASKGQKSHVLAAIGLSDAEINGSLRLTLGATNDEQQIRTAARLIKAAVAAEYARQAPATQTAKTQTPEIQTSETQKSGAHS